MNRQPSDKRTPGELRTLYATNPSLRDIIVEGREDRNLVRWFLAEAGIEHPRVYAVNDRVVVDAELVLAHGGEVGHRGRVLALGREASQWGLPEPSLTCVIDRDRDCLAPSERAEHVLMSDAGSMDVYAFEPKPLQQFLDVVVGVSAKAEELVEELTPPLNELFLVRAAMHEVAEVSLVPKFPALVNVKNGSVDASTLVRRSLDVEGQGALYSDVMERYEALRAKLPEDRRLAIRGHDIAPLLVRRLGLTNDWAKPSIIEQALRGCLDAGDLAGRPLFAELLRRTQS